LPIDQVNGRPMGKVLVRAAASADEQISDLKKEILSYAGVDQILYQASGEEWRLDLDREWLVSSMVTSFRHAPPGNSLPVTTSRLGQTMSEALDRIAGHLTYDVPHAQRLLPEGLEVHADRLCVPRQVAKIMERDLGYVCESLDEIAAMIYEEETPFVGHWRQEGVTPRMLLELARRWSCNCLVLIGSRQLQRYRWDAPEALLVASWWGDRRPRVLLQ